ncbi:hypothetical protein GUJ93_ZPchr0001g32029 [Zizania palustris]|uniref:Uncharacterized protein n=1 Tax=Zizania palustris TaxID=103762 RepID=A0A8J5VC94_ZIZPA|nr:hypothetical protein GUJ93_ZPchr0001g32029 [Zizania palustris]
MKAQEQNSAASIIFSGHIGPLVCAPHRRGGKSSSDEPGQDFSCCVPEKFSGGQKSHWVHEKGLEKDQKDEAPWRCHTPLSWCSDQLLLAPCAETESEEEWIM